jgi:transcriptional regulator with XRE-family HTH domain
MTGGSPRVRTLAEKLEHLIATVHPKDRGPFTNAEIAALIRERDPENSISDTYIWQLRKGKRDNPTKKHLEALAAVFGVVPTYWYDDEVASRVDDQLSLATAMRDLGVRAVALRASELSPASLQFALTMIEELHRREAGGSDAEGSS